MKKKIVIADDDRSILEALKIVLDRAGYKTETILNGKSLLNHVPDNSDLILLDIRMSGADGMVICKHLKSQDATRNIPVIMISAIPGVERIARDAHADGFLEKPFNVQQLLNTIEKHTGKRNQL